MAEHFVGRWVLIHSDKYEDFLKALNVPWYKRKNITADSPVVTISFDKKTNTWQIKYESTFRTTLNVFKLQEEFEGVGLNDEKFKVVFTLEGKTLVETCTGAISYVIWRDVSETGILKATFKCGNVMGIRIYKRDDH